MQTLAFIALVFGGQATIYAIRGRHRPWGVRPSAWMLGSSLLDVCIASGLATAGVAMSALPILVVAGVLAFAASFALALALAKVPVFIRLGIV